MVLQFVGIFSVILGVGAPSNSFLVEARHIQGKKITPVGKIILLENQVAVIQNSSQEPFVTAVEAIRGKNGQLSGEHYRPTITVLTAGVSLKIKVREHDLHEITHDKVFVDATAEISEIGNCDVKVLDDRLSGMKNGKANETGTAVQVPQVQTKQTRLLAPATLGQPLRIPIGDKSDESIEIVVRRGEGGP